MADTMTDAYEAGRSAFHAGASRLSCPHPAPFTPPRGRADVYAPPAGPGAFWLDGFEHEERIELITKATGQ